MNPDYAIFVFPRPWTWLSLACFVTVFAMYATILWRQRRARLALIKFGEGLADIAARAGLPEQVALFEAQIAKLQPASRWFARRKVGECREEVR